MLKTNDSFNYSDFTLDLYECNSESKRINSAACALLENFNTSLTRNLNVKAKFVLSRLAALGSEKQFKCAQIVFLSLNKFQSPLSFSQNPTQELNDKNNNKNSTVQNILATTDNHISRKDTVISQSGELLADLFQNKQSKLKTTEILNGIFSVLNHESKSNRWLLPLIPKINKAIDDFLSENISSDIFNKNIIPVSNRSIKPQYLISAKTGLFNIASNIEIPINNFPDWTVLQTINTQVIKHNGKFETFFDPILKIVVPAVISKDNLVIDIGYNTGTQIKIKSNIQEFEEKWGNLFG